MSCCGKTWKLKIDEKCAKHPQEHYLYFCTNQNCLEILCKACVKAHEDAHYSTGKGESEICGLAEVEAFFEEKAERAVEYEQNRSKPKYIKDIDPCQTLCHKIDEYFYGNSENKLKNEQARKEGMKNPNAIQIIEIVQKQSEYRLSPGFKHRYFELLDSLLGDLEQ